MARSTSPSRQLNREMGYSLNFSAASNSVVVPTTSIDPTTGMTIALWVKIKSMGPSNGGRITDKHATANGYNFLCLVNNVLSFQIDAIAVNSPVNSLPLNQWTHVACTYDKTLSSNQISVYVNGNVVAMGTNTANIGSDGGTQRIGNRADGTRAFDGRMGDYHFYTRGLTPAEVYKLARGIEPSTTGLVQRYKMDEGTGSSTLDSSGNANTGTITGAAYSTNVAVKARLVSTGRYSIQEMTSALKLDGATSYVLGTNTINIPTATLALWINIPAKPSSNSFIAGFENGLNNAVFDKALYIDTTGKVFAHAYDGTNRDTSTPANPIVFGQWNHLAATFDGTNAKMYLNGSEIGTVACGNTYTSYSVPNLFVGGNAAVGVYNWLAALVDDVRVYNSGLTASQISDLARGIDPRSVTLISRWKFDESVGTTVADSSGSGNTGTITSAAFTQNTPFKGRLLSGDFDTSLDFRAASSRVTVTDQANLRLTSAMTFAAWIKPYSFGSGGTARLINKIPNTAGYQVLFLNNTSQGTFRFSEFGGNYDANGNSITLNVWQHMVITFDKTLSSNQINFYINGINVGSATKTTDIATDTSDLIIGDQGAGGKVHDGLIDDLRLYNVGLTPAQVLNLYKRIDPPSTGLVLWHKYNEVAGTTAIDYSGSGNTGTIANAIYTTDVPFRGREIVHSDVVSNLPNGLWTWFNDPRAVRYVGSSDKTYFGYVNSSGDVIVSSIDNLSGTTVSFTLKAALQVDDHDNPAILIRPDGKIQCFYSRHSADNNLYYRISTNAEDISAFDAETTGPTNTAGANGCSYSNPWYLSSESKYFMFWRGGDWNPAFSTSTDGTTWGTSATVITNPGQRPYVKYTSNGTDKIHIAYTDGHPNETTNSIHHCYYQNGNFYKTDGTLIKAVGSLPLAVSDGTLVYDGTSTNSWIWDIALDSNGYPVIVYATFPSTTNHKYRYARWNGSAWIDNAITTAGPTIYGAEPYYSPGISLDHDDPSIVYLARKISPYYQIYKYVTADGGATWRRELLDSSTTNVSLRPVSVLNHGNTMQVLWFTGTYTSYTSYSTTVKGLYRSY